MSFKNDSSYVVSFRSVESQFTYFVNPGTQKELKISIPWAKSGSELEHHRLEVTTSTRMPMYYIWEYDKLPRFAHEKIWSAEAPALPGATESKEYLFTLDRNLRLSASSVGALTAVPPIETVQQPDSEQWKFLQKFFPCMRKEDINMLAQEADPRYDSLAYALGSSLERLWTCHCNSAFHLIDHLPNSMLVANPVANYALFGGSWLDIRHVAVWNKGKQWWESKLGPHYLVSHTISDIGPGSALGEIQSFVKVKP
jgi:hypothetical protein